MSALGLSRRRGGAWLFLVALALFVRLAVPNGYMLSPQSKGFALVICTGHGPYMQGMHDAGGKMPAGPSKHADDHVCPFAGGLVLTPPDLSTITTSAVEWAWAEAPLLHEDIAPGRGLAAPPPPSHAPPAFLI